MRILKFGGSSLGTPEAIERVIEIICDSKRGAKPLAVIVSAYQGVTNSLIELANNCAHGFTAGSSALLEINKLYTRHSECLNKLCEEKVKDSEFVANSSSYRAAQEFLERSIQHLTKLCSGIEILGDSSPKTLDEISSFGELLSASALTAVLNLRGIKAEFVDARRLITTNSDFGQALVDFERTYKQIASQLKNTDTIYIVTGFIASTPEGKTTTLGRGGSDYTGSIIAAGVNASVLEIWTDVDGVLTSDPRRVKKAFPLKKLSYKEAMELCHFGAKVIFPPTLQPTMNLSIPVKILNTFNPTAQGTIVANESANSGYPITGISAISGMSLLRLQGSGMVGVAGIAMRLFRVLAQEKISVVLITQASSEHTICLAIKSGFSEAAKRVINGEFSQEQASKLIDPLIVESELSIVSVVGEQMRERPGVSAKVFSALGENGVNIIAIAQGSSELNISVVVKESDEDKALNALHDQFFYAKNKTLNVYLAGLGVVGSTLIKQILNHRDNLLSNHYIDLNIVALANSRNFKFINSSSDIVTQLDELNEEKVNFSLNPLNQLLQTAKELNLPNSIFVDCTASSKVASLYREFLHSSITVITSNKKSQTGPHSDFKELKNMAKEHRGKFLYETSVGAGLPIISTLNDLLKSGDRIIKIEAILSGTLSYLFNTFNSKVAFSKLVKTAKDLGYTEPHPREDLSGVDVARKVLILARECGAKMELEAIETVSLIPSECAEIDDLSLFFLELEKNDSKMLEMITAAERENKRLAYVATLDWSESLDYSTPKARVQIEAIGDKHPFYNLSGSDNIVSFTTERYDTCPLVVRGPGAGAEVTAAGVLADIVRVAGVN
jgi:bifunctional aspartokinase / homoserine dehydrogenase 1